MGTQCDCRVMIVGAGAVGLLLGNFLGRAGVPSLILDQKTAPDDRSRAIGVTPLSLELLRPLGLDDAFLQHGVRVRRAFLHGRRRLLGRVEFDRRLPQPFSFILSLPQRATERVLEAGLESYPHVRLMGGCHVSGMECGRDGVRVSFTDVRTGSRETLGAEYVCGCDGKHSVVRRLAGIAYPGAPYRPTFLMEDFIDDTGLGSDAHLFFTPEGAVESFALPEGKRRWVVETDRFIEHPGREVLADSVTRRTGFRLDTGKKLYGSPFGVQHYLASVFARDRVILCGDAAHVISPIGGQGLNVGMGDAEFCGRMLGRILDRPGEREPWFRHYHASRRRAARAAMHRAGFLTWMYSRRGRTQSAIRNTVVALAARFGEKTIATYFAMLNLPDGNVSRLRNSLP